MKKSLIFLALSSCSLLSNAQSTLSLSAEDKLSSNTVSSICEDALGRIWMATKSGVDRFDGYDVDVFYHDQFDEKSIQSNLVNKVYRDLYNNIWICNANGLALYDSKLDNITRVQTSLKSIENIVQVSPDLYLLCSQSASILYNMQDGSCKPFEPDASPFVFYNASQWKDCFIFCTSAHNLEFISFANDGSWSRKAGPLSFPKAVHGVIFDSMDNIWTDAFGEGLWKIDPVTFEKTLVHIKGLPTERIECICSDAGGRIWLGTKRGLCIYDNKYGSAYSPNKTTDIRTLYMDSGSNIWIGTTYAGAICRLSSQKQFTTIELPSSKDGNNLIRSLESDSKDSILWIGTQHGGVYRTAIPDKAPEFIADIEMANSVCIHPSFPSTVFVASFIDGIYSIDKKNGDSHLVYKKPDISLIYPAAEGKLWAGSLSGLYLVDPARGTATNTGIFPNNSRQGVSALMTDSDGFLWVGCREGLYRCQVQKDSRLKDVSYPGMSEIMRVQALAQSSDSSIWIGTSDGLMSLYRGELRGLVQDPALNGRSITGIREGNDGELWITTDNGLFRYDFKSGSCSAYYASNGLQSNHFTTGSIISCGNYLCIGGHKGISIFDPDLIHKDTTTVAPIVSSILVHNKAVHPGDGSGILDNPIGEARNIVIRHNQNAFSFRFSCPDFTACGNNIFWHKMEGFEKEWVRSTDRTATYTNLHKGKYTFRVRAANTSGTICPDEVAINVKVKPVWYKTNAFLLFLLLLFSSVVTWILFHIIERANEKNEEKLLTMKDKYEKKLLRAKIKEYVIPGYVPTADEEKMILKFIGKIEESVSNPELSVESLASYMCMSRCNLHLKVKNLTGNSPIDLVKKIRIEKACEMLRQGNLPLSEIADNAGFASTSYFCSAFKKATGHTPKEYASLK